MSAEYSSKQESWIHGIWLSFLENGKQEAKSGENKEWKKCEGETKINQSKTTRHSMASWEMATGETFQESKVSVPAICHEK